MKIISQILLTLETIQSMEYIPKIGDEIYVDTWLYVTHGEDDFIGGLCTVTNVRNVEGNIWIEIAEDDGSLSWNHLKDIQKQLKAKFGTNRGYKRPDYREEFNRL